MESDKTTAAAPSENLVKVMIGYENLPENEKKAFEAEISKAKTSEQLSEKIMALFSSTRDRITKALKKSKLTKVTLESKEVPEQIIDNEIDPTAPLYLTITSGEEMEDEIRLQVEELTEKISKEFGVDKFAFVEIFHDYYELLHYYIFTNESENFNNYFPEGYEFNGYNTVDNSYNNYILRNYSKEEVEDAQSKLLKIFGEQFPHRGDSRLIRFISKSNFVESLLGFKNAMLDHNKKFN